MLDRHRCFSRTWIHHRLS